MIERKKQIVLLWQGLPIDEVKVRKRIDKRAGERTYPSYQITIPVRAMMRLPWNNKDMIRPSIVRVNGSNALLLERTEK